MKLSEAARLGSQWTQQAFCSFSTSNVEGEVVGTCFFGAAAHGMLGRQASASEITFMAERLMLSLPYRDRNQIIRWNDELRNTREEIAAVLEEEGR